METLEEVLRKKNPVKRPIISNDLEIAVGKFVKEHTEQPKIVNTKNVKHVIENGCSIFVKEIDNDVIVIKRLNSVLSALEVDFLLKNSPLLRV